MSEQISGSSQSAAPLEEELRSNDEMSFAEVLLNLAQHKWLIAKITAVFAAIGLIVCFVWPVRYTAEATIMPPKQSQSTLALLMSQFAGGMGMLADSAGGGLGLKDPNAIYVGLLKSRPVADQLIQRFDLVNLYGAKDMTGARKKLESCTDIQSEKSTLISVAVKDRDKKRAADMANAYTDILRELTKSVSVSEASRRRLSLEEQLKDAKESLVNAEGAFVQVQQNQGLIHLDTQAKVAIASLAGVRADIAEKEVELKSLRSFSTEHNPDVQIGEHELSALQDQASRLEQHNSSAGFSDLGLKDIPKAGLDYLRAAREFQYQQAFFDVLLKEYEAARLDEAKEGAVIQVVEPAIPPDRKSEPMRALILVVFVFLGLLSSCTYVHLRQWYLLELTDPLHGETWRQLESAVLGRRSSLASSLRERD